MPVLRFQQPRPPCRRRRGALRARFCRRDRRHRRARTRTDRLHHLLRRRHAVADAARDRRHDPRRDRAALACRSQRRGHARGQPDQRRSNPLSRISRGRRQPGVARGAGAGRRRAQAARTAAFGGRGARRRRGRAHDLRPLFVRPDLCTSGTDAAGVGGRAQTRARASGRASVALSAHHRAGHGLRLAARGRQARGAGRGSRSRALRYDPSGLRGRRPARLRNLQPRATGRGMPAQSRLLARARICRHRAGRARPARYRTRAPRHRDREAAGDLVDAG